MLDASGGVNVKYYLPACKVLRNKIFGEEKNQIKKKKRGRGKTSGPCAKVKGDMLLDYYCGRN